MENVGLTRRRVRRAAYCAIYSWLVRLPLNTSALMLVAAAACSDRPTVTMPSGLPPQDRLASQLSPAVAKQLDAHGRFTIAAGSATSQFPEISQGQATLLAVTWAHQFGPRLINYLQGQHGGPINFPKLHSCGRTLYARSAFGPIPPELAAPYRKPYGSWYLATLCDAGELPTVSVAVSAWSTDLTLANGRIVFPAQSGNDFFPMGIPVGSAGEFPASPETAASLAAGNGRLVASVPELVMPVNTNGPPQGARWHVSLDGPANLRGVNLGAVSVSDVFVGALHVTRQGLAQFVAQPTQPTSVDVLWRPLPNAGETVTAYHQRGNAVSAKIPRRVDTPISFDAVTKPAGQ